MLDRTTGKSTAKPRTGTAKATRTNAAAPRTAARKIKAGAQPAGDLEARIQQRAYELWERDGRPEGREHIHWAEAEREIAGSQRAA